MKNLFIAKVNQYQYGSNIYVPIQDEGYALDNSTSTFDGWQVVGDKLHAIKIAHANINEAVYDGQNWQYPCTPDADEWSDTYDADNWSIDIIHTYNLSDPADILDWEAEKALKEYFDSA